eukprot:TRINITY_DN4685_c0_g1_i28.p2 TRINITY_DN4685_c0_g1~~TRINITY_DN4685_c0_g1_i28.p2  ORF type:complete len:105 (-),score=42.56 TRINITY_DN4685_c0_g1_i28:298-612(-)
MRFTTVILLCVVFFSFFVEAARKQKLKALCKEATKDMQLNKEEKKLFKNFAKRVLNNLLGKAKGVIKTMKKIANDNDVLDAISKVSPGASLVITTLNSILGAFF